MLFGNFMFCKTIKNDCSKLYFKTDNYPRKIVSSDLKGVLQGI